MQLSSLPILIALIFGSLWWMVRRLHLMGRLNSPERNWIAVLIMILLAWGGFSAFQSDMGTYTKASFLRLMPGYWLPFVPVVITLTLVMLVRPLRDGLRKFVDGTPDHWLTGIHMLRILAIGGLIKASMGLFSEQFAWFVGGPDLIFGGSAIAVTLLARGGRLTPDILIYWHLLGALVILVPMTGLMHVFVQDPLFPELFAYPMALAPTLVVPVLVMLNLMVAWRLLEKRLLSP